MKVMRIGSKNIVFLNDEDYKVHYKKYLRILTIAVLQGHIT